MMEQEKTEQLQKIPLNDEHIKLGAKMVPFGGYLMPVQYELGILKEHELVRTKVGLFDISHMGELLLEGKDVESFLQKLMTNDIQLINERKGQYACICYENGTVVDDCFYYKYSPLKYRMIINASNIKKDLEWFNKNILGFSVSITDLSKKRGRFALQGPFAQETLQPLIKDDLNKLQRFYFLESEIEGIDVFIARTGYTGEDGFEISFNVEYSKKVLYLLLESGKPYSISLIGLGARDTLRLEACYSLYGHEISDKITPIEASIGFCVKDKPMEFNGKKVLLDQKKNGTERKIVGVELIDKGIIRDHYEVYNTEGNEKIGYITSGTFSPTLKKSIGLALIRTQYAKLGNEITIDIKNKKLKARVVQTPFYTYRGRISK